MLRIFFTHFVKIITVDKMGVDEMGVDKMGNQRSGNKPFPQLSDKVHEIFKDYRFESSKLSKNDTVLSIETLIICKRCLKYLQNNLLKLSVRTKTLKWNIYM